MAINSTLGVFEKRLERAQNPRRQKDKKDPSEFAFQEKKMMMMMMKMMEILPLCSHAMSQLY
jgi:hypothetical protein